MEPPFAPTLTKGRGLEEGSPVVLVRPPRFHPFVVFDWFLRTEGDTIIKEGDEDRALFKFYIVEEGEARAYVHEDGDDVLMSHLRPGEEIYQLHYLCLFTMSMSSPKSVFGGKGVIMPRVVYEYSMSLAFVHTEYCGTILNG